MKNKVLWVLFLFMLVNSSSVFAAPLVYGGTTIGWTDRAGNGWLHLDVNGGFLRSKTYAHRPVAC